MRKYLFKTPVLLKKLYPGLIWDKRELKGKNLFLTFDDGPIPDVTPWVLKQLKDTNIKATFFMVGENVKKHPEIFRQVVADGHTIGNHTYNHLNGWKTSKETYLRNVRMCEDVLIENGVESNLFRPPYGKIRRDQIADLKADHHIIMWDYLTGDFDKSLSKDQIVKNFKKKIVDGSIVVFHDNIKSFEILKESLPEFLQHFKRQQYNFLTL